VRLLLQFKIFDTLTDLDEDHYSDLARAADLVASYWIATNQILFDFMEFFDFESGVSVIHKTANEAN
jgi:hypothetical protein